MAHEQDEGGDRPLRGRGRRLLGFVALAAGGTVAVAVVGGSLSSVAEVTAPTPSSSAAVTSTAPAITTPAPATSATPPIGPDPADVRELQQVAAALPALTLSSPSLWDQWLPEGRPYPQASIDEDALTCPRLSAQLGAAIGQEVSYWTGTLPEAGGCAWVETPLSPDNYDYDHVFSVGFEVDPGALDDPRQSREGPGQGTHPCPAADLPGGGVLVRCADPDLTTYSLTVPDTRLDDGVWRLHVTVDAVAPVRPDAALLALVEGAQGAFG